jgi:hypothetical protein
MKQKFSKKYDNLKDFKQELWNSAGLLPESMILYQEGTRGCQQRATVQPNPLWLTVQLAG